MRSKKLLLESPGAFWGVHRSKPQQLIAEPLSGDVVSLEEGVLEEPRILPRQFGCD